MLDILGKFSQIWPQNGKCVFLTKFPQSLIICSLSSRKNPYHTESKFLTKIWFFLKGGKYTNLDIGKSVWFTTRGFMLYKKSSLSFGETAIYSKVQLFKLTL